MATLHPQTTLPDYLRLEHDVATILTEQELYGWTLDERAAWELASTLQRELRETERVLQERHPFCGGSMFTPRRDNKTQGYYTGCTSQRLKQFNPTSRDHIAWIFQTFYDWNPTVKTATGKATIDEAVLKDIGSEVALQCLKCLELKKQLGMLTEGVNAWLKLSKNGLIHHHCSVATQTHRCAHRKPNLAQVPSDGRFRRLFTSRDSYIMVGADLAGIELRLLSHYLSRYDGGRFARLLLEDDIHQVNADKIGVSRRDVKTITYAFLYGAGDIKIGHSLDKTLSATEARNRGKDIRGAFVAAIDGLSDLLAGIRVASNRGYVKLIDGRRITLESEHKALNYLLQGSAGVVAKRWMVIVHNQQLLPKSAHQLAFIHDELQYEAKPSDAEQLATLLELSAEDAGMYYNLRVPIAAESTIGANWAETH